MEEQPTVVEELKKFNEQIKELLAKMREEGITIKLPDSSEFDYADKYRYETEGVRTGRLDSNQPNAGESFRVVDEANHVIELRRQNRGEMPMFLAYGGRGQSKLLPFLLGVDLARTEERTIVFENESPGLKEWAERMYGGKLEEYQKQMLSSFFIHEPLFLPPGDDEEPAVKRKKNKKTMDDFVRGNHRGRRKY